MENPVGQEGLTASMKVAGARKAPAIPRHALVGGDKHARTAVTPVPRDIRRRNAKSSDCYRRHAIYARLRNGNLFIILLAIWHILLWGNCQAGFALAC
jgi:hypothetical protein